MAFSSTYNTTPPGSAVSNREDLTDILTVLEPQLTPLTSLAPKRKAKATYHEWTVDKLRTPDGSGSLNEGSDVSSFEDKFEGMDRLGNNVQGYESTWMVSQVQNKVSSVGSNSARARVKALQEIKRDVEASIASNNDRAAGTASSAPQTRGLGGWVDTSIPNADVTANYRTPSAQVITSLTEDNLVAGLASMFRTSGDFQNVTLVADTTVRSTISDFTRAEGTNTATPYTVNQDSSEKKVTLAVDFYESDFGVIKIVNSNPACSADTTQNDRGFIVDFSKVGWAELLPIEQMTLENQGGGDRGLVQCWGALEVLDPRAHCKIDLSA